MDIFNTLTPEALVDAIAKQMQHLIATGGDDVVRLRKELEKTPNDIETWFNLGLALNQAGLQYEDLAVRLAELRFSPDFQDENMMPEEEMPLLKVEVSEGNVLYTEALQAFDHVLELDPDYYAIVDLKNHKRIIHALEVCYMTGKTFTSFRQHKQVERPFQIIKVGLNRERSELFNRINLRVEQMMREGMLEEAKRVYSFRNLNSLNTVGYKELFKYLDGEWTLEEAVEKIKRNTRIYAKKQLT